MSKVRVKEITLGSGHFYTTEFTREIPEDSTIETEENRLAYTKGGASVEYTAESYTEKDDFGIKTETIITQEDVIIKGGLLAWDGYTLETLSATARVEDDAERGVRTVKIGGIDNDNGKSYLIRFVHKNKKKGDKRLTIVGKNQAGFTLAFATDSGTVVEPEFKAEPMDDEGTLLIYQEPIPVTPGP